MTHTNATSGFECLRKHRIASLNIEIQEYIHTATGAKHYHMAANDSNNAFMVSFLTLPEDSTGAPHILEHTALCGSRKYPVRDPFFMMLRRSLNTFMNAFTSSDWTAYPFASQNKKDFNNLLQVYLEAAFFPHLDAMDFAQEGHRLEFSESDNADSELLYKGVVFNEMKGALSAPVSRLWQEVQSRLFPTLTYHHNSGGEPTDIPNLSHAGLKAFHAKHYHPSNAIFMTYGDFPVEEHQANINALALSEFEKKNLNLSVPDEIRYTTPRIDTVTYPVEAAQGSDKKTHTVLAWLMGSSIDLETTLTQQLVTDILLDNSASPLLYSLETTDLGNAPSPLCGYEDSMRESVFACGVEGSNPEHAEAVEALILDTLQSIVDNGVPHAHMEAMLHQLELSQREVTGGNMPYGMQLMLKALPAALHQGDPFSMLDIAPILNTLRTRIADPDFIRNEVKKILDNPHRIRLSMVPDTTLAQQMETDEKKRLSAIKAALSTEEKTQIIEQAAALKNRQEAEEDADILPKVLPEDIPEHIIIPEGIRDSIGDFPLTYYPTGTNGLVYQQLVAPIPDMDTKLKECLPLYFAFLTELGCGQRDYRENQAYQAAVCGGIHAASSIRSDLNHPDTLNSYFILASKALCSKQASMSRLLLDTFVNTRFDETEKLRELIAQMAAERAMSITGQGHSLAMSAASAGLSPMGALNHQWGGLAGIQSIKHLDKALSNPTELAALSKTLTDIHNVIKQSPLTLLLVCEEDKQTTIKQVIAEQLPERNNTAPQPLVLPYQSSHVKQAWITGTQVNFCAKAYKAVPQSHPDSAALTLLGSFLRNNYLHRTIREQGGAYGGGATYSADEAVFRFYSYRDPRLADTLQDFEQSVQWLLAEEHDDSLLDEAVLGVISSMDKPSSPAGESIAAYFSQLHGCNKAHRVAFRKQILAVSIADLKRVAKHYLQADAAHTAVITNQETFDKLGNLGLEAHYLE